MKITETRKIEQELVNIYNKSKKKVVDKEVFDAQQQIKKIFIYFQILSIYTKEDHVSIITKLYFSSKNIIKLGVRKLAEIVYIPERTLHVYRKKYCEIIKVILSWEDTSEIKQKNISPKE